MRPLLLASLLVAAGCAHNSDLARTSAPSQLAAAAASAPAARSASPSSPALHRRGAACSEDLQCGSRELCVRGECVGITASLAECNHVNIHFAFDSPAIPEGARSDLARSARCLEGDQALHVTIAGNADERGTDEYNMALGDQRATAVSRYLRALGVSDEQLGTVSYGKERPLCVEHDEGCWSKNRRAELGVAAR